MNCPKACDKHWEEKSFSEWNDTFTFVRDKLINQEEPRWIFRGVSDYSHGLTSSLDRAFDAVGKGDKTIRPEERWEYEATMLYQFKRRAHHYLGADHTPCRKDFLEWFSLMRHYGAPSRLVDFSYSFYVAAYFAVSPATNGDAAVYCVNHAWLVDQLSEFCNPKGSFQDPAIFWEYAMQHPSPCDSAQRKKFIVPVRPFRSNERIHVQQGLFLCPTDVNATFMENLQAMCPDRTEAENNILKIRIPSRWRKNIMHDLNAMNISSESLYPGLGGFALSIKDLLYFEPLEEMRLNDIIQKAPQF